MTSSTSQSLNDFIVELRNFANFMWLKVHLCRLNPFNPQILPEEIQYGEPVEGLEPHEARIHSGKSKITIQNITIHNS